MRSFRKRFAHFCIAGLVLLILDEGCTRLLHPPSAPSLVLLSSGETSAIDWSDSFDSEDIRAAVKRSVEYYRMLGPGTVFEFGDTSYSSGDMMASMQLFLDTINSVQDGTPEDLIRERFLILESRNESGSAFFTGYYEPVLAGSRTPTDEYPEPVYETPCDLIEVDLGQFSDQWKNEKIVGRLEGNRLVPYDSREEIVYRKSLTGRAEPIAYVNEVELFFLQIQGSGLLRLGNGETIRLNYAQRNGHPYRAIGRLLSGRIPEETMSLQSLKSYLHEHPDEVRDILNFNQSYVFFRTVDKGPLGDIEVPLTPERSIAMDSHVVPRGSLAFIETEVPVFENGTLSGWRPVRRFVLVQDTGGAIRGHGRADIFFGNGTEAELRAGHMKRQGRVFLLVAKKQYLK